MNFFEKKTYNMEKETISDDEEREDPKKKQ
jgi:hypothetical protein